MEKQEEEGEYFGKERLLVRRLFGRSAKASERALSSHVRRAPYFCAATSTLGHVTGCYACSTFFFDASTLSVSSLFSLCFSCLPAMPRKGTEERCPSRFRTIRLDIQRESIIPDTSWKRDKQRRATTRCANSHGANSARGRPVLENGVEFSVGHLFLARHFVDIHTLALASTHVSLRVSLPRVKGASVCHARVRDA